MDRETFLWILRQLSLLLVGVAAGSIGSRAFYYFAPIWFHGDEKLLVPITMLFAISVIVSWSALVIMIHHRETMIRILEEIKKLQKPPATEEKEE